MSILYHEKSRLFSLTTANALYQMKVDEAGILLHLYYGAKTDTDMGYLLQYTDRGFSGNPYEQQMNRGYSLDTLPQEYAGSGVGDYRIPAIQVLSENGSRSVDLRYASHEIRRGRKALQGLPYVRGNEQTEALEITLRDETTGLMVKLIYNVFADQDVITRSACVVNDGKQPIQVEKAASMCMDFLHGDFDMLHFHGRHCMERVAERVRLPRGVMSFGSHRGMSSHHNNPFVILCDRMTTETSGDCYGVMLMYSGNHLEEAEVNQAASTRIVSGIHPDGFSWRLLPGEQFETPEAILSFSENGLNGLSGNYHRIIREHVIPDAFRQAERPVLINSWEACYFDFDAEKILNLADSAQELGMDMLVLDDGWFGKRDDDHAGLGDWTVNEKKLGMSMKELSQRIHAKGLKFGLWFEPEMINEDSDLYRAHPDWALCDPDRKPMVARKQLVLDMSRQEVVDYLFDAMAAVLDHAQIEYVKWDFNRSVANVYSHALPAQRQGELAHRFMLGTYSLLTRLRERYPSLLIEGCAGGGGRFDAGMLFYCPQIWCSDDSDAIERLEIQRGTSYGYPVCTMGAHVSASPNHQTGRRTPFATRGIVAQAGTFGYELNPAQLPDEDKAQIRQQIADHHRYSSLIAEGTYYRLGELDVSADFNAWMFVSPMRDEALVSLVMTHVRANGPFPYVRLLGLDPEAIYRLEDTDKLFTGAALMRGGISFPLLRGDYPAMQLHFIRETA